MKRWWMGALPGLLIAMTVSGCGTAEAEAEAVQTGETFVRVVNVEVMPVVPEEFVEEIRLTAAVLANQDVMVSAEESGVVRTLFVDRGARLSAGDPIAKLDDAVLAAQVEQAAAAARFASETWDRRKRLWEESQVGSEIAYLESKYAAEQTAASLKALQERLDRTTIRAPFAGVLDERHVEIGSMVSPGTTIGRVVDLSRVKIMAGVPERYAPDVRVGAEATIVFDVLPGETFTGPIRFVGATVSATNRTFLIEVVLPNANRNVKPQMIANMAVIRQAVSDAIVAPQDALVRVEGGYVVFVAVDGAAQVRQVELGPTRRNMVVIERGLAAGDRLIVVGQKSVADGDRVNVVGER